MSNLITEISEQHARLRKLEGDLEALKSQVSPARKRIKLAREALDDIILELASGQSSLPLFRGNGQDTPPSEAPKTLQTESSSEFSEADHQPVRTAPLAGRSKRKGAAT